MPKIALRRLWATGLAGLALICLGGAPRGAAAQDASDFIAKLGNEAIQVMGPAVPPAQRAAVFRRLLQADFELPEIARFVLGPYGRTMSPAEHREFDRLFRDTLAQTYAAKLGQYAGEPFRVIGSRAAAGGTIVMSQAGRPGGKPVEMDWHVIDRDGRFLITDVFIDGVSMKVSQRSEFAAIIQRNGGQPAALIAALRQQVEQSPARPAYGSSAPSGPVHLPYPSYYRPVPAPH